MHGIHFSPFVSIHTHTLPICFTPIPCLPCFWHLAAIYTWDSSICVTWRIHIMDITPCTSSSLDVCRMYAHHRCFCRIVSTLAPRLVLDTGTRIHMCDKTHPYDAYAFVHSEYVRCKLEICWYMQLVVSLYTYDSHMRYVTSPYLSRRYMQGVMSLLTTCKL